MIYIDHLEFTADFNICPTFRFVSIENKNLYCLYNVFKQNIFTVFRTEESYCSYKNKSRIKETNYKQINILVIISLVQFSLMAYQPL